VIAETLLSLPHRKQTTPKCVSILHTLNIPTVPLSSSSRLHAHAPAIRLVSPNLQTTRLLPHLNLHSHPNLLCQEFFVAQMMGLTTCPKMSANFNQPTPCNSLEGPDSDDASDCPSMKPSAELTNSTVLHQARGHLYHFPLSCTEYTT
jgi:hypothetical protein